MNADQAGLFPEMLPQDSGVRAPLSPLCARQIALIRIAEIMAEELRADGKPIGDAALVDATRLLGGEFCNNARKAYGLAAELYPQCSLPANLQQDEAEVEREQARLAGPIAEGLERASARIAALAHRP